MHYTKDMNLYFSGIGGVGIGPLAEIARDAGYSVQGSDSHETLVTRELAASGVWISTDQTGAFLDECHQARAIDWFVHTAALPADHPELLRARELGLRIGKRDELLSEIIRDKQLKLIAVAGTHGKTTTTGMMVWALKQLGAPVSYSVGTTLSFGPSGHYDPSSEYFVYECDEFDRNFLAFHPHLALVTSIDYDHPDTYPTPEDYTAAFSQFLGQSEQVILWQHDVERGVNVPEKSWNLSDNEIADFAIAGRHNRANATLVAKGLEYLNTSEPESVKKALESFPGTDRRFERLADNLYSDYGHHPAEITATLQMARELSDHVMLVYQPHQNARQHEIRAEYTDAVFAGAEVIYWLPTYLSREKPDLEVLSPEQLSDGVHRIPVQIADMNDDLWQHITKARAGGKLVLCMGAGSIDTWVRQQLTK